MEFFAKRPGMAVGKPIAKGAKALGTATGRAISEGVHRASINGWKQAAEGKTVINPFNPFSRINSGIEKTRDENGNEVYDTTSAWQKLRGKKEYRTFTTDASGNTKMNVTVQDKKGRRTEVETDAYATVTRKYDRDGVKMREDTKVNAALLKYAMKKDGTYNPEVVSNFMQNSLLSEENKQIMFVQAVMKERMGEAAEQMGDSFESRTVEKGQDEEGRETWTVNQTNRDGSRSTFKVTFGATTAFCRNSRTSTPAARAKRLPPTASFSGSLTFPSKPTLTAARKPLLKTDTLSAVTTPRSPTAPCTQTATWRTTFRPERSCSAKKT